MSGWLDDIEKAQKGKTVKPTEDEVSRVQRGLDALQFIAGYIKNSPLGKIPGSAGSALGLLDSYQNNRPINPADVVGLAPGGVAQMMSETLDQGNRERKYMEQFAKKSKKINPKIELKETAPVIMDTFQSGGEFLGTTNKGLKYNGAWGGPAQNGASVNNNDSFESKLKGGMNNDIPVGYASAMGDRTNTPQLYRLKDIASDTKDYYNDWINSPMYKKMIGNELDDSRSIDNLTDQRLQALDTQRNLSPRQGAIVGGYIPSTKQIMSMMPLDPYIDIHEDSHAQDFNNESKDYSRGNIPKKSIDLMSSSLRAFNPNEFSDKVDALEREYEEKKARGETPEAINLNSVHSKIPLNKEEYDYLSKPTEVRARLNTMRKQLLDNKIANPFTNEITIEHLDKLDEATDEESYDQLSKVYDKETIQKLMNKVSDNSKPSDKKKQTAQNGSSLPGSVGFSYARTGAPSNGKYAKKTMPSAQNGDIFMLKPEDILGLRKLTGESNKLENPKFPTKDGMANVKRSIELTTPGSDRNRLIPMNEKLQPATSKDEEYKSGRQGFLDWYNNPETKKRFTANTGYDNSIMSSLMNYGANAVPHEAKDKELESFNRSGEDAEYYDATNQIGYKTGSKRGTFQHEMGHASGFDSVLGPALKKVLGSPYQQKQNKRGQYYKAFPEEEEKMNTYLNRPEEMYGNFHGFRIDLGLKPGEKIDKASLLKRVKEKKLEKSNLYRFFDDDKIVKAINTIASTNNISTLNYAKSGGSITKALGGGAIKDDNGYWNPNNWGKVVEIGSNNITMKGVRQPLLGISDTGDTKFMQPGQGYQFEGNKVTEYPIAQNGLTQLDQIRNFTNYNKLQPGGWLDQYN